MLKDVATGNWTRVAIDIGILASLGTMIGTFMLNTYRIDVVEKAVLLHESRIDGVEANLSIMRNDVQWIRDYLEKGTR